ncbi:MAG TPA: hypothetical protein PKA62_13565, partial [Thermoanaerobaculia bacterium]|nr:hypothetical protein [Thermoanaerobaculia bacterium]
MPKGGLQRGEIGLLELADEKAVAVRERLRVTQEVAAERGRHREGDDEGGEDRDEIGEAERGEEPPLDAGEEEERDEDEHDDERREDDRAADLRRRRVDDLPGRLPLLGGPGAVLAQAPEDVLDVDDRVVDEAADRDREAPEGHRVERRPHRLQCEDGDDERDGERHEGDERRPGIEEEEEEDDRDEDRPVAKRDRDVPD